jgi:hypothetical protein|tara:strand:- start:111 stop:272 length:162 start_codon:yes stop_codon:yes gene_type:complete
MAQKKLEKFREHYVTTEELLERMLLDDRNGICKDDGDGQQGQETHKQKPLCKN